MEQQSIGTTETTSAEDLFLDVFQEALGMDALGSLAQQYPTRDIYDAPRYIDFALIGRAAKYAFEVDGEFWHRPDSPMVTSEKFRDDLLRQNSLVHGGWRIYRWSDLQLAEERERVKEQLRLFLEQDLAIGGFDGYLPRREAVEFSLYDHQRTALDHLASLREAGKSIALLVHATGTGKTATAILDAQRVNRRTLYLVHRAPLVRQVVDAFHTYWSDVSCAEYRGGRRKPDAFVVVATIQAVHRNIGQFGSDEFGYVVVDEAHHAPASTFKTTIGYFRPQFLLGLTATPDRMDGRPLLDVFAECAPPLGLQEAIEKGLLSPIRCIRVVTNVDLTRVRFNGTDYRASDLEERILVPARDRLVVETYLQHVAGRPGVTFCANVRHAETLSELYQQSGVPARAVSGRMSRTERDAALDDYSHGRVRMLCACDLLNEGWDSPQTEVLMMARPTLSKVLYVQQLGRGTRLCPGKECLYVFDFIDNTSRYGQALSIHRVLGRATYRAGALVAAPPAMLAAEQEILERGETPPAILHLGLYATRLEEVDLFNWQTATKDMVSAHQMELILGVSDGTVTRWVEQGRVLPDHVVEIGERSYFYFRKDRDSIERVRIAGGVPRRSAETRKRDFLAFVSEMSMNASYKPVLLLSVLDCIGEDGRAPVEAVTRQFRAFYEQRALSGKLVEAPDREMSQVADMTDDQIAQLIFSMPFTYYARRQFLRHERDLALIGFDRALWRSLTPDDLAEARQRAMAAVDSYYERLARRTE